jgi:uncharacterized protein YcaQ
MRNLRPQIDRALDALRQAGQAVPCALVAEDGTRTAGWIRPEHLELAARLRRTRPDPESARLLSPFDPVLWDRGRVARLFGFEQVLEIFKPAPQRVYGYFCLPVLAGEHLVARVDLRVDRKAGVVRVVASHLEAGGSGVEEAVRRAVARHAGALGLGLA